MGKAVDRTAVFVMLQILLARNLAKMVWDDFGKVGCVMLADLKLQGRIQMDFYMEKMLKEAKIR